MYFTIIPVLLLGKKYRKRGGSVLIANTSNIDGIYTREEASCLKQRRRNKQRRGTEGLSHVVVLKERNKHIPIILYIIYHSKNLNCENKFKRNFI